MTTTIVVVVVVVVPPIVGSVRRTAAPFRDDAVECRAGVDGRWIRPPAIDRDRVAPGRCDSDGRRVGVAPSVVDRPCAIGQGLPQIRRHWRVATIVPSPLDLGGFPTEPSNESCRIAIRTILGKCGPILVGFGRARRIVVGVVA